MSLGAQYGVTGIRAVQAGRARRSTPCPDMSGFADLRGWTARCQCQLPLWADGERHDDQGRSLRRCRAARLAVPVALLGHERRGALARGRPAGQLERGNGVGRRCRRTPADRRSGRPGRTELADRLRGGDHGHRPGARPSDQYRRRRARLRDRGRRCGSSRWTSRAPDAIGSTSTSPCRTTRPRRGSRRRSLQVGRWSAIARPGRSGFWLTTKVMTSACVRGRTGISCCGFRPCSRLALRCGLKSAATEGVVVVAWFGRRLAAFLGRPALRVS
jgi:hypothetical protein